MDNCLYYVHDFAHYYSPSYLVQYLYAGSGVCFVKSVIFEFPEYFALMQCQAFVIGSTKLTIHFQNCGIFKAGGTTSSYNYFMK